MTELHELSALEQAAAVRAREVSPVELVDHHLARIEALDGEVHAFVTVTAEPAREQARAAEQAVVAGEELPPLHGVPTAIKDLAITQDAPTAFGSAALVGFRSPLDADVVTALRRAGMISLGKTTTPEFGLTAHAETDFGLETRTPWNLAYSAGGSSAGAAAAVSAGMVALAQGSDGGGSIRIPASVCGLVGLKPSWGRVPDGPTPPDATRLSVRGVLTRTVRDSAAGLDALVALRPGGLVPIAGPDGTFLAQADRDPGRLRIGRFTAAPTGVDVDPECVRAVDVATELLVAAGHDVEEIEPPAGPQMTEVFLQVWALIAAATPVPAGKEELLRPVTRMLRERGASITGAQALGLLGALQGASRPVIDRTAAYDVVLCPTLAMPPRPVGWFTETGDPAEEFERTMRFVAFTPLQNATGQPAISLPVHQTPDGLPVGAMLVGRPADEATLISVAAQLESATPWPTRPRR
ncbi:amidase [Kutzneria buriramensis]|uniref:Amidase n=1 Tax=Kutzneria buriramensis TaxID=1045776 RepID=A0A3E0I701_9PSEU|nr:amidase [Kutzneria buriramensis]REH53935.1 amidase [Kutzneria buriramensis]